MIFLLESHPRARHLLEEELADYGEVFAPDLSAGRPLADLIAEVLRDGSCRLLVLGDAVPGASTWALIRLLRAYLPQLPVVVMRRGEQEPAPAIARVVSVPYLEYEDQLVPAVYFLLQECEDPEAEPLVPAKTLEHSPSLARLTSVRGEVHPSYHEPLGLTSTLIEGTLSCA